MGTCPECRGAGIIITCCDDICVGSGHCMHGDGEAICSECEGEGWVGDGDEEDDDGYEGQEEESDG